MKYLVYDIETVPDLELFRDVKYPSSTLEEAREEYALKKNVDADKVFIPLTFQRPVSIATLRVGESFAPLDKVQTIGLNGRFDEPNTTDEMVRRFWKGVEKYSPILVDFNGRTFDLPVLTMHAFRLGLSVPIYFNGGFKKDYRYRYTTNRIDLMDWITAYGSFPMTGGLDLLSRLAGGKGKGPVWGADVEGLVETGDLAVVHKYCREDVKNTYRVFLRTRRLTGELTEEKEEEYLNELHSTPP